jgi:hypothetical protein
MSLPDRSNLEVYCRNNLCGDPVPATESRTFRRMNYVGQNGNRAVYVCPICAAERYYDTTLSAGRIVETETAGCGFLLFFVVILICLLLTTLMFN